ncbi:type II toxin-antitoxin system VapC family toxin [Kordiimonas lipolytica]|uniref:Ribonuclease VapC n=1 Tax=Kordiimonas lipolytica TaxID=1662421 RepID=A0ABV8UD60_9PROT|nr:type II toxin-antitoxin system VapC family toxin [Kordiimonas lipolytica]
MSYLIDTCAISELVRPRPNPKVRAWFRTAPQEGLYLSVLTLGEIRKGVAGLTEGNRYARIVDWLEHDLPTWFGSHILSVDTKVADEWGRLMAKAGRSLPAIDSLIAATAIHHRLTLVTRNTKDFAFAELDIINPWE